MSVEPVFSMEAMVHGYNKYQNAFDAPIGELLSREREVGNIHDTFVLGIKMNGEGLHRCRLSLFQQLSFQFQTSELVINLHMDPNYEHQQTEALNLVVCLCTHWQRKSLTGIFKLNCLLGLGRGCLRVVFK